MAFSRCLYETLEGGDKMYKHCHTPRSNMPNNLQLKFKFHIQILMLHPVVPEIPFVNCRLHKRHT